MPETGFRSQPTNFRAPEVPDLNLAFVETERLVRELRDRQRIRIVFSESTFPEDYLTFAPPEQLDRIQEFAIADAARSVGHFLLKADVFTVTKDRNRVLIDLPVLIKR